MQRVVNYLPTINWQRRAVKRMSKDEIDSILLPHIPDKKKTLPTVRNVLAYVLGQKEMRMADMYQYMVRVGSEIDGFSCSERTCRGALFELKTAGRVKQRFCECGQATYYSLVK